MARVFLLLLLFALLAVIRATDSNPEDYTSCLARCTPYQPEENCARLCEILGYVP